MNHIFTRFALALSLILTSQLAYAQTVTDTVDSAVDSCTVLTYNMSIGSRDSRTSGQVTDLQAYLQSSGYLSSDPSGYFGALTKKAVQSFQGANGITSNGLVGPFTRAKIKELSCAGTTTTQTQTSNTTTTASQNLINFVAGSQRDCNNSIVGRFGSAVATCSIGGGCSIMGTMPSTANPTGNPSLWGACVNPSAVSTQTPAMTLAISANGTPISDGGTVSAPNGALALAWGTSGATSCTLNGVQVPTSGSRSFSGLTSTSYTYTCLNSSGSKSFKFNVNVPTTPTIPAGSFINFVAGSQTDCNNLIATRFGSQVATCSIGGGCSIMGTMPSAANPTGNPSLWGACVSSGIPVTSTQTSSALVITMSANGAFILDGTTVNAPNGAMTLAWGTSGATSCTLNGVQVPTSGSRSFSGLTSTSYTYTCLNSSGSKSFRFNVNVPSAPVIGVPTVSISITPSQIDVNTPFTASWSGTFSPTGYIIKVDEIITQSNTTATSFTGTPASLGLNPGQHTLWVKACTSAGCSGWAQEIFVVTSTTVAWQIPHNTTLTLSKTLVDINSPLTISWSSVNSPATADMTYFLRINDLVYPQGTSTTWTGTPASLGFTPRGYTIYSEACNAQGCDWSSMHDFTVTSPTAASAAPYPVSLTMPSEIAMDTPFTVSWTAASSPVTVPVNYSVRIDNATLDQGTNKSWTGTAASLGLSAGRHMFSVQACNNAGCNWTAQQFLDVKAPVATLQVPAATISVSPSSIATNGTFTASWSGTNAPTSHIVRIDSQTLNQGNVTSWTGTPDSLGLTVGSHSFSSQACNAAGCGAWSSPTTLTVTTAPVAQLPAPSAYLSLTPANPTSDALFTITWAGTNSPTKYWLKINGVEKDLGTATTWTGTPATLGLPAGMHTFYVRACNGASSANCGNYDGPYFLTVRAVLGASTVCTDLPYNFFRGNESQSVMSLQTFLKEQGLFTENPTGFYGDKTVEAVKAYQASHNLPQTGMVYDFTRLAIKAQSCQ